jgi:hypothetical protein
MHHIDSSMFLFLSRQLDIPGHGKVCWVVALWAMVVGAHAAHPKRDKCPLLVSGRMCLIPSSQVTGTWGSPLYVYST